MTPQKSGVIIKRCLINFHCRKNMKKITIELKQKKYPVYLGYPVSRIGKLFDRHSCGKRILVITDENVSRLYSETICKSLAHCGKRVKLAVIKPGEQSKTIRTAYNLIKECSLSGMDRSDTIVALGGGVVCDLAGFVASIYLRGIGLVSIPTSLLAQVDASVGGKTAVNLPWGKNLIGSFYQPCFVVMDFSTLDTLPAREIAQGMAEVIKCAVIRSRKLFNLLCDVHPSEIEKHISTIVHECIMIKKSVVEADEQEKKGIREILNFGHTIGHAIEINSRNLNHGECVSLGMIAETFLSMTRGYCSETLFKNVKELVKKFSLPSKTNVNAKKVADALVYDKKTKMGRIRFVLPLRIGSVKTGVEISPEEVISTWEKWQ